MTKAKGPKPDYRVHALDKLTRQTRQIGAAWNKPDGSISIKLDSFTVISTISNPDLIITCFPADKK